jgi:hypothetical protein
MTARERRRRRTGSVVPLDDPADYARIHRRIKRLWNEGVFEIHQHAQIAMKKRQLDLLDVQHVVLYGSIISHDLREGQWRYRIQGGTVASTTASCVVALVGHVLVVSVLDY